MMRSIFETSHIYLNLGLGRFMHKIGKFDSCIIFTKKFFFCVLKQNPCRLVNQKGNQSCHSDVSRDIISYHAKSQEMDIKKFTFFFLLLKVQYSSFSLVRTFHLFKMNISKSCNVCSGIIAKCSKIRENKCTKNKIILRVKQHFFPNFG